MKIHEFTLIVMTAPNKKEVDRLYSILDDGTITTVAGVQRIHFHCPAPSLESAISSILMEVRKVGLDAVRVEIEPKTVLPLEGNAIDLRARGIDETQAAEMRARLASFAEDWESPEMEVYDNYDEEKAKLQTR